jgi:hypothetical protein
VKIIEHVHWHSHIKSNKHFLSINSNYACVLQHERKKCPAGLDDAGRYSKIILIRLLNFFFIQDYAVILFYFYLHFACVIHDIMALHVFVMILLSPKFFFANPFFCYYILVLIILFICWNFWKYLSQKFANIRYYFPLWKNSKKR